jgi:hypothetical protein
MTRHLLTLYLTYVMQVTLLFRYTSTLYVYFFECVAKGESFHAWFCCWLGVLDLCYSRKEKYWRPYPSCKSKLQELNNDVLVLPLTEQLAKESTCLSFRSLIGKREHLSKFQVFNSQVPCSSVLVDQITLSICACAWFWFLPIADKSGLTDSLGSNTSGIIWFSRPSMCDTLIVSGMWSKDCVI